MAIAPARMPAQMVQRRGVCQPCNGSWLFRPQWLPVRLEWSCFVMFLGSAERRFSVPACTFHRRRAQRLSRLAEGHRRRRREAVLTAASTAPGLVRSGASACPEPGPYHNQMITHATPIGSCAPITAATRRSARIRPTYRHQVGRAVRRACGRRLRIPDRSRRDGRG